MAATAEVVGMFMEQIKVDKNQFWVSDNGKEFFTQEGSNLERYGVSHVGFPPAVHQYLSVCDNSWFGAAKQKWRARGLDYSDDIRSTIAFLADTDSTRLNARSWFQHNLQLHKANPDHEKVAELVGEKNVLEVEYYRECLYDYGIAEGEDVKVLLFPEANDGLDGRYWMWD